ncbi:hypothetical protein HN451_05305 [archaeon]|nr:hypothetical protein [archaeon]
MQFPFSSHLPPIEFKTRFAFHPSFNEYECDKGYLKYIEKIKEDFLYNQNLYAKVKELRHYNSKLDTEQEDHSLTYLENRAKRMEELYNFYAELVLSVTSFIYNEKNNISGATTVLNEDQTDINDFDKCFEKGYETIKTAYENAKALTAPILQYFNKMIDIEYPMHNFKA